MKNTLKRDKTLVEKTRFSHWVGMRNISDYSPFGILLAERTSSTAFYRLGFQGQEHDDEVKGEGNSVNYKYRMHDPRVGRFFAVDPLAHDYPYNSNYAFSENVVINATELEGLEKKYRYNVHLDKKGQIIKIQNGQTVIDNSIDYNMRIVNYFDKNGDFIRSAKTPLKNEMTKGELSITHKIQTTIGKYNSGKVSIETSETQTTIKGTGNKSVTQEAKTGQIKSTSLKTKFGTFTASPSGEFTYGNDYIGIGESNDGSLIFNIKIPTGFNGSTYNTKIKVDLTDFKKTFDNVINNLGKSSANTILPLPLPLLVP